MNINYQNLLEKNPFINNFQQVEPRNRYADLLQQELALENADVSKAVDYNQANVFDNLQNFQNYEQRPVMQSNPEPVNRDINYSGSSNEVSTQDPKVVSEEVVNTGSNNYGIGDYVNPLDGKFRITSSVGKRKPPKTAKGYGSSWHHGTDFAHEVRGTKAPVRNITAGQVIWTGRAGGYGNVVLVKNPQGYVVQYAHLDKIGVRVGDTLNAGSNIGIMGSTGNSSGVHLDMTVIKNGKTLDRNGRPVADAPRGILARLGRYL